MKRQRFIESKSNHQSSIKNDKIQTIIFGLLEKTLWVFSSEIYADIELLANDLMNAWKKKKRIYMREWRSAANAVHMANDFHYGIGACGAGPKIPGLRIEALPANEGIITCLANDTGYENIYAHHSLSRQKKMIY